MVLHQVASHGNTDLSFDLTTIILGFIVTVGTTITAVMSRRTNKRLKTNQGKTIGEHVEGLEEILSSAMEKISKTLEEARLVRDHEAMEVILNKTASKEEKQNLEVARQRVATELENLAKILNRISPPKEGDDKGERRQTRSRRTNQEPLSE